MPRQEVLGLVLARAGSKLRRGGREVRRGFAELTAMRTAGRDTIVVCLLGLGLLRGGAAWAGEQRCADLEENCHCSEPLNTNRYTTFSTHWMDPADTTAKQCSRLGDTPGMAVERDLNSAPTPTNDSAVLDRFPSGHFVTWVLRGPTNHTGQFVIGEFTGPGSGVREKVRAFRWYQYWSPDFEFAGDGTCTNSKAFEWGDGGNSANIGDFAPRGGNFHAYLFQFWKPTHPNCCIHGWPDRLFAGTAPLRDRWWRFELHVVNASGGVGNAIRYRVYAKNVTNNARERLVVDTAVADRASARGWPGSHADLTPYGARGPSRFAKAGINAFRNPRPGGQCRGFAAFSHVMYAAWSEDTGQRIGAANEIEGGATGRRPPPLDDGGTGDGAGHYETTR